MIAIKDMEMPKNCADCNMGTCNDSVESWNYVCSINLKYIDINESERAENCPLVEIVTCQNCKHLSATHSCNVSRDHRICPDAFYCANGERRE